MRRYWPAIATCFFGIVLVVSVSVMVWRKTAQDADAELSSAVEGRIRTEQVGLSRYEDLISTLRIYVSGAGGFPGTRKFTVLVSGLLGRYDGVQALAWAPRVSSATRADFEARAQKEGLAGFHIMDRTADGRVIPASSRDEYFPIEAYTHFNNVLYIQGLDIGSERERHLALERARDTGEMAVTGRVRLLTVARADDGWGILIFSPVYPEGEPKSTVEERRAHLVGFVVGVFRTGDMLEAILNRSTVPLGLDQYFFDGPIAAADHLIHIHPSRLRNNGQGPLIFDESVIARGIQKRLTVAGRQWTSVTLPIPGMFSHRPQIEVWGVLLVGLSAAAIATLYVLSNLRRTESLRALAEDVSRRDNILDAVTTSAAELLHSAESVVAFPKVLERVTSTAGASRARLFEVQTSSDGRVIMHERYRWEAPGLIVALGREWVESEDMIAAGLGPSVRKFKAKETVTGIVRNFEPSVRAFLQRENCLALLAVPIFVDGEWWGQVAFDNCRNEKEWSPAEIDTVKMLAELIGGALARERYVRELADAAHIVEASSTIAFRVAPEAPFPLIYISHNVKHLGYHAKDLLASPRLWQQAVHPDDQAGMIADMQAIIDGRADDSCREFRWIRPDGSIVWLDGHVHAIRDSARRLAALEGTGVDISERKTAEEKLGELARTDVLTALPNRMAFIEQLGSAFAVAKNGGAHFAVLYLDIDHFKDINDTLGHPMGDKLLQAIATRLRAQLRSYHLVARFGGDEFAILLAGGADIDDVSSFAAEICNELRAPYQLRENNIRVTASIGISVFDSALHHCEDMLSQADLALYRAKEAGRDGFAFHSEELDRVMRNRVSLSDDLRTALEKGGQLEVYYQPQVEVASGRIIGVEALVRWNHPTRGQLMPINFITISERTGTIKALGRWVLDESCRQMRSWREEGIAPPVVAVNVSAVQFKMNHDFENEFMEIIEKWGLSLNDVELELTESVLFETTQERRGLLERLRQSGIRISIDDFGTGYSSLDYLRNYPFNRLKIAQQFIAGLPGNSGDVAITRATLGLAREFGIDVIAEGIETAEQAAFLTSIGCRFAQGYYFSLPVPADGATALLRRGRINVAVKTAERKAI